MHITSMAETTYAVGWQFVSGVAMRRAVCPAGFGIPTLVFNGNAATAESAITTLGLLVCDNGRVVRVAPAMVAAFQNRLDAVGVSSPLPFWLQRPPEAEQFATGRRCISAYHEGPYDGATSPFRTTHCKACYVKAERRRRDGYPTVVDIAKHSTPIAEAIAAALRPDAIQGLWWIVLGLPPQAMPLTQLELRIRAFCSSRMARALPLPVAEAQRAVRRASIDADHLDALISHGFAPGPKHRRLFVPHDNFNFTPAFVHFCKTAINHASITLVQTPPHCVLDGRLPAEYLTHADVAALLDASNSVTIHGSFSLCCAGHPTGADVRGAAFCDLVSLAGVAGNIRLHPRDHRASTPESCHAPRMEAEAQQGWTLPPSRAARHGALLLAANHG